MLLSTICGHSTEIGKPLQTTVIESSFLAYTTSMIGKLSFTDGSSNKSIITKLSARTTEVIAEV